jgi:hypothetical protein
LQAQRSCSRSRHWRTLEPAEQAVWLDDILQSIATDPDRPTNARFGKTVTLYSERDADLFRILNGMYMQQHLKRRSDRVQFEYVRYAKISRGGK